MEPTTPLSAGDPSPAPTDAIFGFPDACRPVEFPPSGPAGVESSVPWRVVDWDRPDLSFAKAFITARFRQWRLYIPHLELVPCGDRLMPALFLRVGRSEHPDWSTSVEPTQWGWQWLRTRDNPYVVLQLAVWFENTRGGPIGLAGRPARGTPRNPHHLWCATAFDPANPNHRRTIETWVATPAPSMMFFVDEFDAGTSSYSLPQRHDSYVLTQLADARRELRNIPADRRGTFEKALARLDLPRLSRW